MTKTIGMTAATFLAVCGAFAAFGDTVDDAAKMNSEIMNPGSAIASVERIGSGGFRVLIYGNSIALHRPKPDIGWTNCWGMAASSIEKDFAHIVVAGLETKLGKNADFRIRNLAVLERNFTTNIATVAEIAADAKWAPDYVVIAIGENVPAIDASNASVYTKFLADMARPFANAGAKVVLRSPFWMNATKAECTAAAAADTGCVYVDAGPLGFDDENKAIGLFSHSGVANHPGDLGMRRLAELILSGFAAAEDNPVSRAAVVRIRSEDRCIPIDVLCPPRAETAARFKAGCYPPSARPYREAAKIAYRYMVSLPAMTALVETGKPNQKYQHNAYVSKTHAAHIKAMLNWMRLEPGSRETAMRFAKASAEFLLDELEPVDAPLAFWPPTYGRKPLEFDPKTDGPYNKSAMVGNEPVGAVKYRGEVMLVYPASVGIAFVDYWNATKDRRFLVAAAGIADTYLKTRRNDGSWPLKMKLATGEAVGENTLVPTQPLELFEKLFDATGETKWRAAADGCFAWLEAHPLKDWNWDGQFEDIKPEKPYRNPTKHNAIDTMLYILDRFPSDRNWLEKCRKILEFCEKRFVVWEAPPNHKAWPTPCVLEQYSCFTPIDASSAKMIRAYLAMYHAEGRCEDIDKAKALADAVTRVQKPSGRIPTFWEGVNTGDSGLSAERYDWLNCMEAAAAALLEMANADGGKRDETGGDRPHGTCVLQGFPRSQPVE